MNLQPVHRSSRTSVYDETFRYYNSHVELQLSIITLTSKKQKWIYIHTYNKITLHATLKTANNVYNCCLLR